MAVKVFDDCYKFGLAIDHLFHVISCCSGVVLLDRFVRLFIQYNFGDSYCT